MTTELSLRVSTGQDVLGDAVFKAAQREGVAKQKFPPLPAEVFKVVAALQVYGEWVTKQNNHLKKCQELFGKWNHEAGDFCNQLRKTMQVGDHVPFIAEMYTIISYMANSRNDHAGGQPCTTSACDHVGGTM